MSAMFNKVKKQQGMTLLEVIIVLGIMGVIAAGVVVLAQRAIDNQNVTKLSQQLNTLQTAMVSTYRSKKSYPDIQTDEAKSAQLADALVSMGKVSQEDLSNPFTGEPLLIFTSKNNNVDNRGFAIRMAGLTQDQCSSIISNSNELFAFIQVEPTGATVVPDLYVDPNANNPTGVIKSTKGGANSFDVTNLDHVGNLCGGQAGASDFYDVFVGGR